MAKHTTAAEQRRLITRWRNSGTTMTAFALTHGIRPNTFASWVSRQRAPRAATRTPLLADDAPKPDTPSGFVAVAVALPAPPTVPFTLQVGPHDLRFDAPP